MAFKLFPLLFGNLGQFKNHRQHAAARNATTRLGRPQAHRGEGGLDRISVANAAPENHRTLIKLRDLCSDIRSPWDTSIRN